MNNKLSKLKSLMRDKKLNAILVSSVPNIAYITGFTSFSKDEREAFLFITKDTQHILTDGRYSQAAKQKIKNFKLVEISSQVSYQDAIKKLIVKHRITRLGFEGNNLTFLEHKTFKRHFNNLPRRKAGIYHLSISNLRSIKTPQEIYLIEKACQLGDKTFDHILKKIYLGISEKELAFEIEFFIKKNGADISFPPIVAFGANSAFPHHVSTNNQLTNNQTVLLDFGVKLNNYCSDMTRTIFFGQPTAEQKRMYNTVLEAQEKAIAYLQKGHLGGGRMDSSEVDRIARDYIISKGYKTIPHSVGHGIGIEVHETPHLSPKSKDVLKVGMVFSIEPGIYIPASRQGGPGFGGVRIEDLVVLEKSKSRLLTKSPKLLPMR